MLIFVLFILFNDLVDVFVEQGKLHVAIDCLELVPELLILFFDIL